LFGKISPHKYCPFFYNQIADFLQIIGSYTALSNKLVKEGITNIAEKFAYSGYVDSTHVADFDGITDPEDREMVELDIY